MLVYEIFTHLQHLLYAWPHIPTHKWQLPGSPNIQSLCWIIKRRSVLFLRTCKLQGCLSVLVQIPTICHLFVPNICLWHSERLKQWWQQLSCPFSLTYLFIFSPESLLASFLHIHFTCPFRLLFHYVALSHKITTQIATKEWSQATPPTQNLFLWAGRCSYILSWRNYMSFLEPDQVAL
jgi:hypothetical protein